MNQIKYDSHEAWAAEGRRRFGPDINNWKFKCPICGHVASVLDYKNVNALEAIGFSCIGRYREKCIVAFGPDVKGNGPCDYTGGGLFRMNPVEIPGFKDRYFDFADEESWDAAWDAATATAQATATAAAREKQNTRLTEMLEKRLSQE